jgi:Taurine catabolism dioxygenase TauD, TfdA family
MQLPQLSASTMMTDCAMTSAQPTLLALLGQRGWIRRVAESADADAVLDETRRLGDLLGTRAGGRGGAPEEVVRPQTSDDAHPRSLSARYGLNTLPFHVELSHRPRPCRYLLLGCIDPGSSSALTMLLDWLTLGFSLEELHLLEGAPIIVRTGRRSFYSTLLPPDRAFLRYDPGCLEAVDERGRSALSLVERRLALGSPDTHEWRRGDILIIDNRRVLHARGSSEHGSGRRLARILIDA